MTHPVVRVPGDDRSAGSSVPAVVFDKVSLAFDDNVVLRERQLCRCAPGSMTMLLGASGAGKSVVLKLILGLLKPDSGAIRVNGQRTDTMTEAQMMEVRGDIGMLFQESALFDSLTVADNVGYRLYEETDMPADQVRRRVEEVLGFIGLQEYIDRMPSELSGGQRRRVAIARAMAARPRLLLFDDPTSGPRPDHRQDRRRRNHQVARPGACHVDRRDPPASGRVLHRDPRGGAARTGVSRLFPPISRRAKKRTSSCSGTGGSTSRDVPRTCGRRRIRI